MRFPYQETAKGHFGPVINFEIWNTGRWITVDAYVDSGAACTIFHTDIAGILGLAYTHGRKIWLRVGDGKQIAVYLHKMPVRFAGYKFVAVIGFSQSLGVGFNLLGRVDFFDRFRICFNDKEKFLETTCL